MICRCQEDYFVGLTGSNQASFNFDDNCLYEAFVCFSMTVQCSGISA